MEDQRLVIVANGTPPDHRLNRRQRRQRSRRRMIVGERTKARPFHQTWAFTEANGRYTLTVDAGVNLRNGHHVTYLCTDQNGDVHGTWLMNTYGGDGDPDVCAHVALVANHICERDRQPWLWGDDAA